MALELDPIWFVISVIFSIVSGVLIIFLLAIQSWVLVKLLPEIKRTARNSSYFTETLAGKNPIQNLDLPNLHHDYPEYLRAYGIKNCQHPNDPAHIHTKECFN